MAKQPGIKPHPRMTPDGWRQLVLAVRQIQESAGAGHEAPAGREASRLVDLILAGLASDAARPETKR